MQPHPMRLYRHGRGNTAPNTENMLNLLYKKEDCGFSAACIYVENWQLLWAVCDAIW